MIGDKLATIKGPADVKQLSASELDALCADIRAVLVEYGKRHGGHIGPNLGVVELTVALHVVFDSPRDAILFDVSHQSYVHKMLTGRAQAYIDPEHMGEVTGFTNPDESEHDFFTLGHTGTALSLACGFAKARELQQLAHEPARHDHIVTVLGDGALSSGVAFEGLDNAAEVTGGKFMIVLNDNEISIAENHGGMYGPLAELRASHGTSEPNLFKAFGLEYVYVEDGNDVHALIDAFERVKDTDKPIVVHIHTTKGLGLDDEDAQHGILEGRCENNHWQDPIDKFYRPVGARKYYGKIAMDDLLARFESEPNLVVVSPATPGSNGITQEFREAAGAHYVDVGIAEEHAIAFGAGLANAGMRPVIATSSTFFQRTFDQLQQELALNDNPVTLLSFGAGIGSTDNTHSGAFDATLFANIPGLTCFAPTSERMFRDMLAWSTSVANTPPVVIRVPGDMILVAERTQHLDRERDIEFDPLTSDGSYAGAPEVQKEHTDFHGVISGMPAATPWSRYDIVHRGSRVALIGLGNAFALAQQTAAALTRSKQPIDATLIDPMQFSSLDVQTLDSLIDDHDLVVTLEDGQLEGGFGEKIAAWYENHQPHGLHVLNFGAYKEFTDRVPRDVLDLRYGLSVEQLTERIEMELA